MAVKKKCEVQIWRASPSDIDHALWRGLTKSLALAERSKAFQFRFEADRKAYVLAHGLRRLVLGLMLDIPPSALVFRNAENGQPQLIKPNHKRIFFSHSHTREGVLFAVSSDAAVGVDAESIAVGSADFSLLIPFLVLPANVSTETLSFYSYWTALEAFWKAVGEGLSANPPRLRLTSLPLGHWAVALDAHYGPEFADMATHAVIIPVTSPPNCVASLAIIRPDASGAANFVVHEKDLKNEAGLMRSFFVPGSVSSRASRAPHHSAAPLAQNSFSQS